MCECCDLVTCFFATYILVFQCAIDAMVKYLLSDGSRGQKKGLVASAPIYSGENIIEERPLICSQYLWNAEYKYNACEYCLAPLESAEENVRRLSSDQSISLPYTQQSCPTNKSMHVTCPCGTRYCGAECRAQAWNTYHKTLCTAEPTNSPELRPAIETLCNFWKSIHYPPETASVMLLVKILAAIKQSANPSELIAKFNEFVCSVSQNNEEIVHKLLGDKYQEQVVILRDLVRPILYEPNLEQFFTDQGFVSLLVLISQHSQGIGTSSFSKWAENCEALVGNDVAECQRINELIERLFDKMDDVSGPFLNCEGSGLYPISFLINHSCVPNAEVRFPHNNNVMVVKAIDNIEPGEEICISYLDECMQSRSRHSRVKFLQENYFFSCKCRKCESQLSEPDVTSDEEDDSSNGDHASDAEQMMSD